MVTLPVCLVGAAVADDVIRFVYGDEWAPAAGIFAVLVLVTVGRIFVELSYDLLVVLQRTGRLLTVQLLWLAVLAPVVLVAARERGVVGVAVAELAVMAVVVVPCYLLLLRGLRPPDRAPGWCRAHPARRRGGRCRGRRPRRAGWPRRCSPPSPPG